jgi:signal transduction histidine kinase/DNA-binding response OmpR family regulator
MQNKVDSLEYDITLQLKAKNIQQVLTDLHDLSNLYELSGAWEKYHQTVDRMISYSKQIKDDARLVECYNKLGISHTLNGNNNQAVQYFKQAIEICKIINDSSRMANLYENIALANKDMGNYQLAVNYQIKSLTIRKPINHPRIFNNYIGLQTLYGLLNDTLKQDKYIRQAKLELNKQTEKDESQIAIFYNEIGDIYENRGMLDTAIYCYEQVIKNSKQIGWKRGIAVGMGNLAGIYMKMGKSKKALNLHFECLNLSLDINDCMSIAEEYMYVAEIYKKINQFDSALFWNNKALSQTSQCGLRNELASALQQQAELYEKQGNFELAFKYLSDYHALNDSLTGIENKNNIAEIETRYQSHEKERQIELLHTKNKIIEKEKASQRILFTVLVLVLGVISLLFYVLFRNKRKTALEFEKLNQVKSNFFNNVSHELRTPLTLIIGPVTNLLDHENEIKKKQNLQLIQRNAQKLLNLVNQLLDLSKIDAGFYTLSASHENLTLLTKKIAAEFEYLAKSKNIDYTIDIPEETIGWVDISALETILVNLLSNAFKYVNASKKISLSFHTHNEIAFFSIKNTCNFIDNEKLANLFNRFYCTNSLETGTGIGLSLVKELIGLYRANISVQYQEPGEIQFNIQLPYSKNHFSKQELKNKPRFTEPPIKNEMLHQQAFHIDDSKTENQYPILLIVEDNNDMRQYIHDCFVDFYQILTAKDGWEGVALAKKHLPDIIISDIMMPKLDGIGLCNQLKNDELTSHIPIILLTAKIGEENTRIGLQYKADDYITKPFSSKLLLQKVNNAWEHNLKMRQKFSQELMIKPLNLIFPSSEEQLAKNIQNIVNQQLTNPEFNVEMFCEATHLSRTQLHRKLTALTGLSATAFIRSQRVKLAANLLKKENVCIADVCYRVGFNDSSYFSKCFKEIMGETPTEFHAQLTG